MDLRRDGLGATLVALQLALIGALGWLGLRGMAAEAPSPAVWLAGALGLGLAVWSLAANRPGNFNITPEPRAGGQLVTSGPYRWIRHPMYTAVMLLAVACVVAAGGLLAASCAVALAAVLGLKALLEERWMTARHPGYDAYRQGTRRFLPGLF